MRNTLKALCLLAFAAISCGQRQESIENITDRIFSYAVQKYTDMDKDIPDGYGLDSSTPDGKLRIFPISSYAWTIGFYPGTLWYIYEYTGDENIREMAVKRTEDLEPVKYLTSHHDIGFMMNCSYGNALRLSGKESYEEVLITSARSLSTRFNDTVGCIQSWGRTEKWPYPVIIDNMMNLELMMNAYKLSGEQRFADIANSHAKVTAKNHFRDNYSSYHVVAYDPETGKVVQKNTHQGLADESSWARGQAWALYGYTMMYKETGDEEYLALAENIASYILSRLPEDMVPYWDYDSPDIPDTYYESSAAAIEASALIDLYRFTKTKKYLSAAEKTIRTLASDKFLAKEDEYSGFLLKHSNGSVPSNGQVDVPLTYTDYYFLEALLRYRNLAKK